MISKIKNERALIELKTQHHLSKREQNIRVNLENEKLLEEIEDIKSEIEKKKRAPFSKKRASDLRLLQANSVFKNETD